MELQDINTNNTKRVDSCRVCNCKFGEIVTIKKHFKKIKENIDSLSTECKHDITRCPKCRVFYSCKSSSCLKILENHVTTCQETSGKFIFSTTECPNRKEIDYILLPKIFGGYIVNVSRIHYCKDVTLFGFHDTTAKLLKYNNETKLCLWSKDVDIFREVTRNQLYKRY